MDRLEEGKFNVRGGSGVFLGVDFGSIFFKIRSRDVVRKELVYREYKRGKFFRVFLFNSR